MTSDMLPYWASAFFGIALVHSFLVKQIEHLGHSLRQDSVLANILELLGEIEVVFGFWAGAWLVFAMLISSQEEVLHYLESLNFTEPSFVLVILTIASTRPIMQIADRLIRGFSRILPLKPGIRTYISVLVIGPLLGSLITEPAAMTVTALILKEQFFDRKISDRLKYATLGLLFVNVSIGGTLTPYAAPPILMVARTWDWDLTFMLTHFGWKSALAIVTSTSLTAAIFSKELSKISPTQMKPNKTPYWLTIAHLAVLACVVLTSHHSVLFMGLFLFFLGLTSVTPEFQDELRIREGLMVAFFLSGLVVLGGLQRWWLEPLLTRLDSTWLFLGATGLTAITDNAALTYLGSQVPRLTDPLKYSLVAGAVAGGGLTVIANAPNPVGFGILRSTFGEDGINPLWLLLAATPATLIAMICLGVLT